MRTARDVLRIVVPDAIRQRRVRRLNHAAWEDRGFAPPSPADVKRHVLRRNGIPGSTWVETGTFLGDTTHFLASIGSTVHSIEPDARLHRQAVERFSDRPEVHVHRGLSEDVLPGVLDRVEGDVSFWLDGHYSEGITFKGPKDTPIIDELQHIAASLTRWPHVAVLIDDVRCFNPEDPRYATYPPIDLLVDWAREHGLRWHIEHDIFVARR